MLEIAEYIAATVRATPAMVDPLKGGFHFDAAASDKVRPYCVAHILPSDDDYETGDDVQHTTVVQFSFYGDRLKDIRSAVRAFKKTLIWQVADLPNGYIYGSKLNTESFGFEAGNDTDLLDAQKYVLQIEFWSETNTAN